MKQTALFPENNPAWLAQFDCSTLLVKVLELFDSAPVYIVDKDQQVLYWSLGMEELSGLRQEDVVGKSCLHEYVITEIGNNQEQFVKLSGADGNKIEAKIVIQALQDKDYLTFFLYSSGSFLFGLLAVFVGLSLVRVN